MKKCKFCRKEVKALELKKRIVTLPTGLPITSIDPMCGECFVKLKEYKFKADENI